MLAKKKFGRKAQITLFVIIAIILVAAISLVVYIQREARLEKMPEINLVNEYIDGCLEQVGNEAVLQTSLQAGYYTLPEPFLIYNYIEFIPYLYEDGKHKLLKMETIENEISNYIRDEIDFCLDDFEFFREKGFDFSMGKPKANTKIREGKVTIDLNYPITVRKENSVTLLSEFSFATNSNLKKILETANKVVTIYAEKPGFICLSCLDEIGEPYISIRAVPASYPTVGNYILFFVIDEQYKINNEKLEFRFVVEG